MLLVSKSRGQTLILKGRKQAFHFRIQVHRLFRGEFLDNRRV